jgi:hypothetical protein
MIASTVMRGLEVLRCQRSRVPITKVGRDNWRRK